MIWSQIKNMENTGVAAAHKSKKALRKEKNSKPMVKLNSQLSQSVSFKTLFSKEELKNHLGTSIVLTGRIISNEINNRFVTMGSNITFEQTGVLFFIVLHNKKEIIQQDLAAMMNKNKSAILRTIDILEKKNYVRRLAVSNDRRKNIIQATEAGIKMVKEALALSHKLEKEYTKKIKKEDMDVCIKVLNMIQNECGASKENCT